MQLLVVPVLLAGFAAWFTCQRERLARDIEESRTREARLQNYFDRMTELMLDRNLANPNRDAGVRDIARVRTLTVLRGLDGGRKADLLRFLDEARLIVVDNYEARQIVVVNPVVDLQEADFSQAALSGADLSKTNLHRANLSGANLSGANLSEANLKGAALSGADLSKANLHRANLSGAKLVHADLSGAKLVHADLSGAILLEANLSEADLSEANLSGADLSRALKGANLKGANLKGANLKGAKLKGAKLQDTDLSAAKGLTQEQVDSAEGNENTKLPEALVRPKHWAKAPTK